MTTTTPTDPRPAAPANRRSPARRTGRAATAVPAALVALVALVGLAGPAQAQSEPLESKPIATASLDHVSASPGQVVNVRGSGWPSPATVLIEVCGNNAVNGSADCDRPSSITTTVRADGVVAAPLTVAQPPAPCPCVVRLTTQDNATTAAVPLALDGEQLTPGAGGTAASTLHRQLEVVTAELSGPPPAAWFGAGSTRTLTLTLRNSGNVAVAEPILNLTAGSGDEPTGFVAPVDIDELPPGEERTVEVPVEVGAFANGTFTVAGEIIGFDEPVTFTARTTNHLWGLVLLGGVVVAVAVTALLQRRDRRRPTTRRAAPATTARAATPGDASDADIDLRDRPADRQPAGRR